ncbi:monooxygenase [Motilibacter deserti]|uniref:Monooxygenase n=1 Tax=Motilibacter deserti TaxID=2714956 RepID=A0ABX0GRC8_9ACTN|nr:monooxygenase [Motilibacter deserti]NHC12330.1 monooxygenase [Motilibacter deserti]
MTEPYVTLHLWGVPTHRAPSAAARMALDRRPLRQADGLRFAKLLGTGSGRTFTTRDADFRHWALLAVWDDERDALRFERESPLHRRWGRLRDEQLRVALRPLASRGRWSRREPFGDPEPRRHDGPVAALTRARIRPTRAVAFWRAVPPVSAQLHRSPGLRLAVGIGEAPVGLQGTFSLWESAQTLVAFAHRSPEHLDAVRRTAETGWYAEELFARFAVLSVDGAYRGRGFG